MNQQRNTLIGFVSLIVIVGLIFWIASRFPQNQDVSDMAEISGGQSEASQPVIQSHRSYHIESNADSATIVPKQAVDYTFSIVDERGETKKDFATVHEKIMHVIVVREDLQEFQHVHPEFDEQTGAFALNLTFPSDGPYRIFADFTPMSAQRGADGQPLGVTIYEDINVGNLATYKPQPLVNSQLTKSFQGYTVQLIPAPTPITAEILTTLSFDITQNGRLVTNLEEYLGALGHTVVLREGDLEFLHTHALDENVDNQTGTVDFAVTFPTAAKYKVFSQFQHQGKVFTTDFVVTAESKSAGTNEGNEPPTQGEHGLPNSQH